jgi:hypothetical protein
MFHSLASASRMRIRFCAVVVVLVNAWMMLMGRGTCRVVVIRPTVHFKTFFHNRTGNCTGTSHSHFLLAADTAVHGRHAKNAFKLYPLAILLTTPLNNITAVIRFTFFPCHQQLLLLLSFAARHCR